MNKTFFMNILAFLWYLLLIVIVIAVKVHIAEVQQDPYHESCISIFAALLFGLIFISVYIIYPALFVFAVIEWIVRKKTKSESKLLTKLHQSKLYRVFYYFGHIGIGIPIFMLVLACLYNIFQS